MQDAGKFHQRFNIEVDIEEAQRRFVNRVHHFIFHLYWAQISDYYHERIMREVLGKVGEKYEGYSTSLGECVGDEFFRNLEILEALYNTVGHIRADEAPNGPDTAWIDSAVPNPEGRIEAILADSEVDLGIRWQDGHFIKSGAIVLDKGLVNEPLHWLSGSKYEPVRTPFEKGLRHFLHSPKRPEVLSDVITDMYEALEALAKSVTNRPNKELSAIQEQFIRAVKASADYKRLLKDYIDYANRFRHGLKEASPKPDLSNKEAESFIYLTGLFIRLAMP